SSTMAMRRPHNQLKTLDLPTLGRPTIATCGTGMDAIRFSTEKLGNLGSRGPARHVPLISVYAGGPSECQSSGRMSGTGCRRIRGFSASAPPGFSGNLRDEPKRVRTAPTLSTRKQIRNLHHPRWIHAPSEHGCAPRRSRESPRLAFRRYSEDDHPTCIPKSRLMDPRYGRIAFQQLESLQHFGVRQLVKWTGDRVRQDADIPEAEVSQLSEQEGQPRLMKRSEKLAALQELREAAAVCTRCPALVA